MIRQLFLPRSLCQRLAFGVGAMIVAGCTVAEPEPFDEVGGAGSGAGTSAQAGTSTQGGTSAAGTSTGGIGGTANVAGANQGGASAGTASSGGATTAGYGGQAGSGSQAGAGGSLAGSGAGGAGGGSGGSAGGGSGGSAGGAGYEPCPTDGSACKILPLGDSITWGIQYDGAYRVELFSKAVADNHKITFVGSVSNGPSMVAGQTFPKSNEGHSGWTIDQIAGLIPSPALNTVPNIVLLMIGTNDVYAASGQAAMPDRLGKLLDKIIAAAPNALLVVAKITPLSNASWNATIKTYNDAIPGLVQTRAAAGKHVLLADMNTGFTPAMLSNDSVHPNQTGYNFMGDAWYEKIKSLLH